MNVEEVLETKDFEEVNRKLKENWVLLTVYHNTQSIMYVVGKPKSTSCQAHRHV